MVKNSFVCNFQSWTKLFINEGLLPLINFIGQVLYKGWWDFCISYFLFLPLGTFVFFLYALGWPLGALFYFLYMKIFCAFTYIYIKK